MKNPFDSGSSRSFWLALAVVVAALSAPSLLLAAAGILFG